MKIFNAIQVMSDTNADISLAPLSNITDVRVAGSNGYVTFGVPVEVAIKLIDDKPNYKGGLLLCNASQLDDLCKQK